MLNFCSKKNCCYGCSERHVSCHASCEMYAAYKREQAEVAKAKQLDKEIDEYFIRRRVAFS